MAARPLLYWSRTRGAPVSRFDPKEHPMATARQPITNAAKGLIAFAVIAVIAFALFLASHSYLLSISTLVILTVAYLIYMLGMSSGLPGTSGKNGRNVRT
jgi:hypothetical protein